MDDLLALPIDVLFEQCAAQQRFLLLDHVATATKKEAPEVAVKLCQWLERAVRRMRELRTQDEQENLPLLGQLIYIVATTAVLTGAMCEMDEEAMKTRWWRDAVDAFKSLVNFFAELLSIDDDAFEQQIGQTVAQLERAVAALCTRSSELRATLQADAVCVESAMKLRWTAQAFLLKALTMTPREQEQVDLVRWIEPQTQKSYDLKLHNVSGNDQMCLLALPVLGHTNLAREKTGLRMFNWFGWVRNCLRPLEDDDDDLTSSQLSMTWTHCGIFFAGVPFDIARCPVLDNRRVVIAVDNMLPRFRLNATTDFPWLDDDSVEIVRTYSQEETAAMLRELENVSFDERCATCANEAKRTCCAIQPLEFGAELKLFLLNEEQPFERPTSFQRIELAHLWFWRRWFFVSPNSWLGKKVTERPNCPWCLQHGFSESKPIVMRDAMVNLLTQFRTMVYKDLVAGKFNGIDFPTIYAIDSTYGDVTACVVCCKSIQKPKSK